MSRNVALSEIDTADRPVIATSWDYTDGTLVASHSHRRGQLIYGVSGMLVVTTAKGRWVMPPQRGIWIPPLTVHEVRMVGGVTTESVYLLPKAAGGMPAECRVVGISGFVRGLIEKVLALPLDHEPDSHADILSRLLRFEMQLLPELPLSLPLPLHEALAARCRAFLAKPRVTDGIDDWASALGMSRRAFTRAFRRETGLSFMEWRQQACLMATLPRLVAREPVLRVALDLGYENPAAFTTMFKRVLGSAPRDYIRGR